VYVSIITYSSYFGNFTSSAEERNLKLLPLDVFPGLTLSQKMRQRSSLRPELPNWGAYNALPHPLARFEGRKVRGRQNGRKGERMEKGR